MNLKEIRFPIEIKSVNHARSYILQKAYTNDLDSVKIIFELLDCTPADLTGATASIMLYMRDGSFFQDTATITGNTVTYILTESQGNHAGVAQAQIIVKKTGTEWASSKEKFEIVAGLETVVATEVMIKDWTMLTAEARAFIDAMEAAEAARQQAEQGRAVQLIDMAERIDNLVTTPVPTGEIIAEEIIDARDGEASVGAKIRSVDVQLAQNIHQRVSDISFNVVDSNSKPSAYITFVDDDGHLDVLTKLKPISEEKGVPFTIALFKNSPLPTEQGLYLQNTLGWEIASHSYSHLPLNDLTGKDLDDELALSKYHLTSKGYDVRNIVYPYGQNNEEVRNVASKYFNCATIASSGGGGTNKQPVDTFQLKRVPLGSSTATGENTLAFYKGKVDSVVSDGSWLIFMLHCGDLAHDDVQQQHLRDLIDYITSVNAKVVTLDEGNNIYGNKIDVSDTNGDRFTLTNDGKVFGDGYSRFLTRRTSLKLKASDPITKFPLHQISVETYATADNGGFPGTYNSGMLTTYRIGWDGNAYQTFHPYESNKLYMRRWNSDTNTWATWDELATVAGVEAANPLKVVSEKNSYTASSLRTDFPANKVTIFTVNLSGGAGFPNNTAGTCTTYRMGGLGWDYQEFKEFNNWNKWVRYVKTADDTWSEWKQFTIS